MKPIVLLMSLGFVLISLPVFAQSYDVAMRRANKEYNAGKYEKSATQYRKAIQADPTKPDPYRNLARAYFWVENYSSAVAYYDFYLQVNKSAKDILQIRKERNLANQRAGKSVYRRSKSQTKVYKTLKNQLQGGGVFNNKGGSFGMYKTLLRTGFAEPLLIEVKAQLSQRLLDEFDVQTLPKKGEILPLISLESWKIQSDRLESIKKITNDKVTLGIVSRRTKIVLAIDAILSGKFELAAQTSAEALVQNPDLNFLSWFVAASLLVNGKVDLALKEISVLARNAKEDPVLLDYVRVLRALAIQQKGQHEDAAEIFTTILQSH